MSFKKKSQRDSVNTRNYGKQFDRRRKITQYMDSGCSGDKVLKKKLK